MTRCEDDLMRARLSQNLWEEGGGALPERRHANIFRNFLIHGLELDVDAIRFEPSSLEFARDRLFQGRIWRRDGVTLPVRSVHKLWSDYFSALRRAGFVAMPDLEELRVSGQHIRLDPDFFGPLDGTPLHVAMRVRREQ